jgi:hypothetical protein
LKCQLFFLQVSFQMPTRLYLTVFFWASGLIWDANIFYMTCTIVFYYGENSAFCKNCAWGLIKQPHWT